MLVPFSSTMHKYSRPMQWTKMGWAFKEDMLLGTTLQYWKFISRGNSIFISAVHCVEFNASL